MSDLDMQEVMVKSASAEDILESQCQVRLPGGCSADGVNVIPYG